MPDRHDDDADLLAAELALGLLSGEDRAAALRRSVAEPDFAAAVEDWRLRLAPLLDGIAPANAPAGSWAGIERLIDQPAGARAATLTRWRIATFASGALAAGLAAVLLLQPPPPAPPPPPPQAVPLLAQVADAGGQPIVTAQYDAATGRLRVRTTHLPSGERVPELWVIVGDAAPRSLGLVRLNGSSDYLAAEDLRRLLADGVTIAVTLEPHSDTPHAAPSGDVLGTTRLTAV